MTAEVLLHRDDDTEVTVRKRFIVYHDWAESLSAYYSKWAERVVVHGECRLKMFAANADSVRDTILFPFNYRSADSGAKPGPLHAPRFCCVYG